MFNILSFLNLDIVPTLVTVVKYGSIALGLNMTKNAKDVKYNVFDMKGAMFDGLKLMRPSHLR